jgi:hypothetical protein
MKLVVLLVVGWLFVVGCDDPTHRGPEQSADEAGVYSALPPTSVTATGSRDGITVAWKHFGYAVEFVVLRRVANGGTNYQTVAVLPNDRMQDPAGKQLESQDPHAITGLTYVYGVRSRNYDRNGLLIESAVVEALPVRVR